MFAIITKSGIIKIEDFLIFLNGQVEEKRKNADMNEDYLDSKASELEKQIDIYKAGLQKTFPPLWEQYLKEYTRENDSEYQEYLKLKEKFE